MSAVLDAIAGGRGKPVVLMSVSFPGSTVRVGEVSFTSATGGHFAGKATFGPLEYALTTQGGRINSVELKALVNDTDRTIAQIVAGSSADSVRGSSATVYLADPSVASSSWTTLLSGVVAKVAFPQPFQAEITVRADDRLLQKKAYSGWLINRASWPNAPADSIGKLPPIVYGSHDSINIQNGPGLAGPAILVDPGTFKYVVCAGRAKAQTRVFVDGVKVVSPPAFVHETVNGRDYTTMTFTTGQGTAVVTCDMDGLESVGDGTGSIIQNGMTQFAHKLTNFILGDWKTGSWLSTSSLIDATTLATAETFFTNVVPYSTDYVSEQETGLDAIASFCNAWAMSARWTAAGTIAFRFAHSNTFTAPYTGGRVRWYRDEMAPLVLDQDDANVATRLQVSLTPSASQSSFLTTFEVMDAGAARDVQADFSLAFGEAK